jgi:hypothetical protein
VKVPTIIIVDDSVYDDMFLSLSVTVILCCCILVLVSWNLDQAAANYVPVRDFGSIFMDRNINQIITLEYIGTSNCPTRCSTTPNSSLKNRHNSSAYHHIRELTTASNILGYHLAFDWWKNQSC